MTREIYRAIERQEIPRSFLEEVMADHLMACCAHCRAVEIDLIEADEGWASYLSLEDALKLDSVRQALRTGDLDKARALGRIFRLIPVGV